MAEFDPLASTAESNFDNDFEKLEPIASSLSPSEQEEVVSSTQDSKVEEIIKESDIGKPLLDFGPSGGIDSTGVNEAKSSGDSCPESWMKTIDPRVKDLVYWKDPKKSGIVFGSILVLLMSLACFSVLSVVAYVDLALLTVTVSFVVYKKIMAAVQKSTDGHPFKAYLESDISLPEDRLHQLADSAMKYAANTVRELRRLILVEDLVDSLKFGLLLWVFTYIGAWFNGMTLVILAWIAVFSVPKFYETYKVQIDNNIELIRSHVKKIVDQVKEKIPFPGKAKKE